MHRKILIFSVLIRLAFGQTSYCGVKFTSPSGVITSPNYPYLYPSNLDCKMFITTTPRHNIKLVFNDFKLESSDTCSYDFVAIYDGSSTESTLLGKFCDVRKPLPILSSGNKMHILFKSDGGVENKGFNATYTTEGKCTYTLSNNFGEITSPNYPNNYSNMEDCAWLFTAYTGRTIQLDFNTFDLQPDSECDYDWVEIYDGNSNQHSMLNKFCGTELPQTIQSTGNSMYMKFHSDDSVQGQGFNATYRTGKCLIRITGTEGEINSPNYPDEYPSMDECEWHFSSNYGYKIKLVFDTFELQSDRDCNLDSVAIHDGDSSEAPTLGKFCGSQLPHPVISSGNKMLMVFKSDGTDEAKGFRAQYTTGNCMHQFTNIFGEITSPNYPYPYPNNQQCEWLLTTTPGHTFKLNFDKLELEGSPPCGLDWVAIYDGPNKESPILGKYCSISLPSPISSSSNVMYIKFRTDGSVQKSGFKITYVTEGNCTYHITSPYGEITSPNYPANYTSSENCAWLITTVSYRTIRLSFNTFHLQADEECKYDWVAIYDGDLRSPMMHKICGDEFPALIESSGSRLYVVFHSDGSIERQGFNATYRSGKCNYEIRTRNGEVNSPFFPENYINMEDCTWHFLIEPGYTMRLDFETFDLQPDDECRYDWVAIYDGNTTDSPMLGKFCGSELPQPTISSSNSMFMVFHSDGSVEGQGFKAKSKRGNCMYFITNPFGQIMSPNFPNNYPNNAECEWLFTTTPGRIIKMEFNDFDLQGIEQCYNDWVIIFDGYNTSSPMLGKFCGNEIPDPVLSTNNWMYVVFKSDYSGSRMGFKATYMTEGNCTHQITNNVGEISSPNYPENYPNREDCMWIFITIPQRKIRLDFITFDLQPGNECDTDWIAIYDLAVDRNQSSTPRKFCGNQLPPPIISSGTMMYMMFKSDDSVQRQGFKATYRAEGKCLYEITNTIAQITSPHYPNNYTNMEECEWFFNTTPEKKIMLAFDTFDLQFDDRCEHDWIVIYDGNRTESTLQRKFCGNVLPPPTISSGSSMYMKFKSDDSVRRQGFKAKYITGDCLYDIRTLSGEISTPNFPSPYLSMMYCTWLFTVTPGLVIKLDFEEFELESSSDCRHDSVDILDGYSMSSPLLGRFCGNEMPHPVISSSNRMHVIFKSYQSSSKKGFRATYSTGDCLYFITTPYGEITSPNFPDAYPSMQDCSWIIVTTPGHMIKLIFNEFDLDRSEQCMDDWVVIHDGVNPQSPMLNRFCGSSIPRPLMSSANKLYVAFKTNGAIQRRGFNVTYATVNCSYDIHTPFGEVTSPNFPDIYPKSTICEWFFTTTPGHKIKLVFNEFELEYHSTCNHDRLTVYDGNGPEGTLRGSYCGSLLPSVAVSSGNSMYMVLKTDGSVQKKGFKLIHSTEGKCTYEISTSKGDISSPNYPNNYPRMENCAWLFVAAPGEVIKLDFNTFDLQPDNKCDNDWLAIYDADWIDSRLLGKFCGGKLPPPIISSGDRMYIAFKSDGLVEGRGFNAKYSIGSCIYSITNSAGAISSPNYPATYLSMVDCSWFFTTTPGHVIKLVFNGFDLQPDEDCDYDWIAIYDGESTQSPLLGKFCGSELPHPIESSGNMMYVVFESDGSVEGSGFNATYSTGIFELSIPVPDVSVIIGSVIAAILFISLFALAVYFLRKKMNSAAHGGFTYSWWKEKSDPDESSLYGQ